MEVANYQDVDLIIFDISKSYEKGLEIAERVKEIDPNILIIFASDSLESSCVRKEYIRDNSFFLKKPINYEEIQLLVSESRRFSFLRKKKSLLVKNEQGIIKIRIKDILFLERSQRNILIHTQNELITSCKTMKEYQYNLREPFFYRCHTSFIVNTDYIADIQTNEISMINKKVIPLSRYRRNGLIQIMSSANVRINLGLRTTFKSR
ncbi:LytTr DNA-binding domain protein [compost metagenome]